MQTLRDKKKGYVCAALPGEVVDGPRLPHTLVQDAAHSTDAAGLLITAAASRQQVARSRLPSVIISLVTVQAVFGGNAVVNRAALNGGIDPLIFSFLRDIGASAVLLLGCYVTMGRLVRPRQEDLFAFALLGVLGVYIGQTFQVMAQKSVTPVNALLWQPSQPVFAALISAMLGMEPLQLSTMHGRLKLLGIVVTVCGAVFSTVMSSIHPTHGTGSSSSSRGSSPLLGNLLLCIQVTSGASYQVLQKHVLSSAANYPPLIVATYGYVAGTLMVMLVLPVCRLELHYWTVSIATTWKLAYAVFLTSAFNYALCAYANKHSSPTLVTSFFPLQVVCRHFPNDSWRLAHLL